MYVIDMITLVIPLMLLVLSPLIYFAAKSAFPELKTPIKQEKKVPNESQFTVNFSSSVISQTSSLLGTIPVQEKPIVLGVAGAIATSSGIIEAISRSSGVSGAMARNSRVYGTMARNSRVSGTTVIELRATPIARNIYEVIYGEKNMQILEPSERYYQASKIISIELLPKRKINMPSLADKKVKSSSI